MPENYYSLIFDPTKKPKEFDYQWEMDRADFAARYEVSMKEAMYNGNRNEDGTYTNPATGEIWNPAEEYNSILQQRRDRIDFFKKVYDDKESKYTPQDLWDYKNSEDFKKGEEEYQHSVESYDKYISNGGTQSFKNYIMSGVDSGEHYYNGVTGNEAKEKIEKHLEIKRIITEQNIDDLIDAQIRINHQTEDEAKESVLNSNPNTTEGVTTDSRRVVTSDYQQDKLFDSAGFAKEKQTREEMAADLQKRYGISKEEAQRSIAIMQLYNDGLASELEDPIARMSFRKTIEETQKKMPGFIGFINNTMRDRYFQELAKPLKEKYGIDIDTTRDNHNRRSDSEMIEWIKAVEEAAERIGKPGSSTTTSALSTAISGIPDMSSPSQMDDVTYQNNVFKEARNIILKRNEKENKLALEIGKDLDSIDKKTKEDALEVAETAQADIVAGYQKAMRATSATEMLQQEQRGFFDPIKSMFEAHDKIPVWRLGRGLLGYTEDKNRAIRQALYRQEEYRKYKKGKGNFKYADSDFGKALKNSDEVIIDHLQRVNMYKDLVGNSFMGNVGDIAQESFAMGLEFAAEALVTRGLGSSFVRAGGLVVRGVGVSRDATRAAIGFTRATRATQKFEDALSSARKISRTSFTARRMAYKAAIESGMSAEKATSFARSATASALQHAGKEFAKSAVATAPLIPITASSNADDVYTQSGIVMDEDGYPVFRPQMSYSEAYNQAFGDSAIEILSESTGVFFAPMLGRLTRAMSKVTRKVAPKLSKATRKGLTVAGSFVDEKLGYNKIKPAVNFIQKYANFSGIPGEMFEERIGDVARTISGINSDSPIAERFGEMFADWTDGEKWATELVSFSLMPMGHMTLGALAVGGNAAVEKINQSRSLSQVFGEAKQEGKILLKYWGSHPELVKEYNTAFANNDVQKIAKLNIDAYKEALADNYIKSHKISIVSTPEEADGKTKLTKEQAQVAAVADFQRKRHPEFRDIKDDKLVIVEALATEQAKEISAQNPQATSHEIAIAKEESRLMHYLSVVNANIDETLANNQQIVAQMNTAIEDRDAHAYITASRRLQKAAILNVITGGQSEKQKEKQENEANQTEQTTPVSSNAESVTTSDIATADNTASTQGTSELTDSVEKLEATTAEVEAERDATATQTVAQSALNAWEQNKKVAVGKNYGNGTITLSPNIKRKKREAQKITNAFSAHPFDVTEVTLDEIQGDEAKETANTISMIGNTLTGSRIVFYKHNDNASGYGELGMEQDGVIFINTDKLNDKGIMINTLGHEYLHFLKQWSFDLYKIFKNAVMDNVKSNPQINFQFQKMCSDLIADAKAKKYNKELFKDGAEQDLQDWLEEEWVARNAGRLFTDAQFLADTIARAEQLKAGSARKLLSAIKEFLSKLLALFRENNMKDSEFAEYKKIYDTFKEIVAQVVATSKEFQEQQQAAKQNKTRRTPVDTKKRTQQKPADNTVANTVETQESTEPEGKKIEQKPVAQPQQKENTEQEQPATATPATEPVAEKVDTAVAEQKQEQVTTTPKQDLGDGVTTVTMPDGEEYYSITDSNGRKIYTPVAKSAEENPTINASTPDNSIKVELKYELVPMSQIIISADKEFDQQLQPRGVDNNLNREATIQKIAQQLDPQRLFASSTTDSGSPILDENNMAMTGNTRMEALRIVMTTEAMAEKKEEYTKAMLDFARRNSIFIPAEQNANNPLILVRRPVQNMSPETKVDFVNKSNESNANLMSDAEKAYNDALLIQEKNLLNALPENESGEINLNAVAYRGFVNALKTLPNTSDWFVASGENAGALTESAKQRIINALIATVFIDMDADTAKNGISKIISAPDGIKKPLSAITQTINSLLQIRKQASIIKEKYKDAYFANYDIMPILGKALETYAELLEYKQKDNIKEWIASQKKNSKITTAQINEHIADEFFAQGDMFRDDASRATMLLVRTFLIGDTIKNIRSVLQEYIESAKIKQENERQEASGQDNLFGLSQEEKSEFPIYNVLSKVVLNQLGITVELNTDTAEMNQAIEQANNEPEAEAESKEETEAEEEQLDLLAVGDVISAAEKGQPITVSAAANVLDAVNNAEQNEESKNDETSSEDNDTEDKANVAVIKNKQTGETEVLVANEALSVEAVGYIATINRYDSKRNKVITVEITEQLHNAINTVRNQINSAIKSGDPMRVSDSLEYLDAMRLIHATLLRDIPTAEFSDALMQVMWGINPKGENMSMQFPQRVANAYQKNIVTHIKRFNTDLLGYITSAIYSVARGNESNRYRKEKNNVSLDQEINDDGKGTFGDIISDESSSDTTASIKESDEVYKAAAELAKKNLKGIYEALKAGDIANKTKSADKTIEVLRTFLSAISDSKEEGEAKEIVDILKQDNSEEFRKSFAPNVTSKTARIIHEGMREHFDTFVELASGTDPKDIPNKITLFRPQGTMNIDDFNSLYPNIRLSVDLNNATQILPYELEKDVDADIEPILRFNTIGIVGVSNLANAYEHQNNYKTANDMRSKNIDPHKIKLATGWEYLPVDDSWRLEVNGAKFNLSAADIIGLIDDTGELNLADIIMPPEETMAVASDVIDAPEIMEAYPEFKDYIIRVIDSANQFERGYLDFKRGIITINNNEVFIHKMVDKIKDCINDGRFEWAEVYANAIAQSVNMTLTHETQHYIQVVEGFAYGGNPTMFYKKAMSAYRLAVANEPQNAAFKREIGKTAKKLNEARSKLIDSGIYEDVINAYDIYRITADKRQFDADIQETKDGAKSRTIKNAIDQYIDNKNKSNKQIQQLAHMAYKRIAGEVDARNAARRSRKPLDKRMETLLTDTEEFAQGSQFNINKEIENGFALIQENIEEDPTIMLSVNQDEYDLFGTRTDNATGTEYVAPKSEGKILNTLASAWKVIMGSSEVKVANQKQDLSGLDLWTSLPSFYRHKTEAGRYFYSCADEMERYRTEIMNSLLDYRGVNDKNVVERIEDLKKTNKEQYDKVMQYIVARDMESDGLQVEEQEEGEPEYRLREKDGTRVLGIFKTEKEALDAKEKFRAMYYDTILIKHYPKTTFAVKERSGKVVKRFVYKHDAWSFVFNKEFAELVASKRFPRISADAIRDYRFAMYRAYELQSADMANVRKTIEGRGESFEGWLKKKGNEQWVNIYEELNSMGQHLATYMPRIRKGKYFVDASKIDTDGKKLRIKEPFDSKIMAAARMSDLKKQGWSNVRISLNEAISADVRVSALGIANTQALINDAIKNLGDFESKQPLDFDLGYGVTKSTRSKNRMIVDFLFLPGCSQEVKDALSKINGVKMVRGGVSFSVPTDQVDQFKRFVMEYLIHVTGSRTIQDKFSQEIQSQFALTLMSSGSSSRKIERKKLYGKEVVTGYIDDPMQAMKMYISALSSAKAKTKFSKDAMKVFTGAYYTPAMFMKEKHPDMKIEDMNAKMFLEYYKERRDRSVHPTLQENLYNDITTTWKALMENPTAGEKVIGAINGWVSLNMLSGVSSGLVNMLSMFTTLPSAIGKYTGESMFVAAGRVNKYAIPYWKFIAEVKVKQTGWKKGSINIDSRTGELFSIIEEYGMTSNTLSAQTLATADRNIYQKAYKGIQNTCLFAFAMTERASRAAGICAAYDALCDQIKRNKGKLPTTREEKVNLMFEAKRIAEMGLADFSKANKMYFMKKSKLLSMPLLFMTYGINQMNLLLKGDAKTRKNHAASALWLIGSTMLLGGIKVGIPMFAVVTIMNALGYDPDGEDDPEEWFADNMLKLFGAKEKDSAYYNVVDRFARYGLVGSLGQINISNSLNMWEFLNIAEGVNSLSDATDNIGRKMLGASGGQLANYMQGISAISQGEAMRGAEFMLPRVFAAPLKAIREHDTGITTRKGEVVTYDGAPIIVGADTEWYKSYEFFARSLGFTPARIAKLREEQYKMYRLKKKYADKRQSILDRFGKYAFNNNWNYNTGDKEMKELQSEIDEYNQRLKEKSIPETMAKEITKKTLDQSLKTRKRNFEKKSDSTERQQVRGEIPIINTAPAQKGKTGRRRTRVGETNKFKANRNDWMF